MANNNFDWVKPYNNNNLEEIIGGEGYLSETTGFPLNWKLESPNYGRLIRRATYLFATNNHVYTGPGSRESIIKTATMQQHGLPIFDIRDLYFDLNVSNNTIVFNLADPNLVSGVISINSNAFTNALYCLISITYNPNDTWRLNQNDFTQVSWLEDSELYPQYFNAVREETYYKMLVERPNYYGGPNTYLENDVLTGNRPSYLFNMVYEKNNTKISTGSERDIIEYFGTTEGVTQIDFNSLNSDELSFDDNNGGTKTFKEYYHNLLVAGERDRFSFLFHTNINPVIKEDEGFFSSFVFSGSDYYIAPDKMLHFTITIAPHGYRQPLDDIVSNSALWSYTPYTISVYIINCVLDPYLYLNVDHDNNNYVSELMDANEGNDDMPVFSNRGWDITTSGTTEYIGYNENV